MVTQTAAGSCGRSSKSQMSTIVAAEHKPIIKKKTTHFNRIQSDLHVRVKSSWRLTRGIDSRFRRKERGTPAHPNAGYSSDKATKYMLPNGFKPVLVHNVKELEPLFMNNTTCCAVIAHAVGGKLRREIEKVAQEKNILVVNAGCRMKKEEQ